MFKMLIFFVKIWPQKYSNKMFSLQPNYFLQVVTVLQPLLLKQKSLSSETHCCLRINFISCLLCFCPLDSDQRSPFAEGMPLAPPTTHVPIHEFFLPSDVGHQVPPTRGPLPHFTAQVTTQSCVIQG